MGNYNNYEYFICIFTIPKRGIIELLDTSPQMPTCPLTITINITDKVNCLHKSIRNTEDSFTTPCSLKCRNYCSIATFIRKIN